MKEDQPSLVESIQFIQEISSEDSENEIKGNRKNIEEMMKGMINSLSKEQSIESIDGLDINQIWAMINSLSSGVIGKYNKFKGKENVFQKELTKATKDYSYEVFNLQKKRKRSKGDDEEDEENDEAEADNEDNEEGEEEDNEEGEGMAQEDMDDEDMNEADEDGDEEEEEEQTTKNTRGNQSSSKTKDQFFNLNDMNKFADEFENNEDNDDNTKPQNKHNDNDENENEEEEEEEDNDSKQSVKYDEFFDNPNGDNKANNESSKDIDMENHLFNQISSIESKMIAPKAWNLKGEIQSSQRPKESLLENPLDFEVSIKPPPIPDKTYTQAIESVIKLRIKDDLFDDPIRKGKVNLNKTTSSTPYEIQFTKDSKGLGEIYENKYLGNDGTEGKVDEIKAECEELANKLFETFDQLTNAHFAPHNIKGKQEMKVTNVPSIQIEEISNYVTDNRASNANAKELLNTRLIKEKTKEELTKEEKQKMHNRKKRNIKTHIYQKEKKKKMNALTEQLGSKFEAKMEIKAQKDKKKFKEQKTNEFKSTKLFENIQKIASSKGKNSGIAEEASEMEKAKNIKKYKL